MNIIQNHDFSQGLSNWHANCCRASIEAASNAGGSSSSSSYAVVSGRTETWQGLEQRITGRVSQGLAYSVSAWVRVSRPALLHHHEPSQLVLATLKLESQGSEPQYVPIEKISVSQGRWEELKGTFSLQCLRPNSEIVFYLEGPLPGVDLHIRSVVIQQSQPQALVKHSTVVSAVQPHSLPKEQHSIIINSSFEAGLSNWSGKGCEINCHDSLKGREGKHIGPRTGRYFACTSNRNQSWNGIVQDITGRVQQKLAYQVDGFVRLLGRSSNVTKADVCATVCLKTAKQQTQYIQVDKVQATDSDWTPLHGKFLINGQPSSVVVYIEGPPPGIDILLDSLVIKQSEKVRHSPLSFNEDTTLFGVNIIKNSDLTTGNTHGWSGDCHTLRVENGLPLSLPPMARDSLEPYQNVQANNHTGRFLSSTERTKDWMGPGQVITDKIKLFVTYQVSAWVRIGDSAQGRQKVSIKLEVTRQMNCEPDRWVGVGEVEAYNDRWYEIGGSFRFEEQPSKVKIYVSGPDPGVDIHVAGLRVFPVDRRARFTHLKKQTDQVRKRVVILELSGANSSSYPRITSLKVRQTRNSFPFGSCLYRSNLDNADFKKFFVKNFNWAVFANELKWYHTEEKQGKVDYDDAYEMLKFCQENNIQVRGHCLFWEVDGNDPKRLSSLNKNDLSKAVDKRLNDLLPRFKGKFRHYDVNNEMLHGSFYRDRLGKDIIANMFKRAKELDSTALLFTNEYNVDDGRDIRSSPEKYIAQIKDLIKQGAPIGGIGIQGHNECPIGPIIRSALDKLGSLGLPIWYTELEVYSANEHVRADDLEVMIREAFAHPAVEGIVLWGFWELHMSDNTKNVSHLVDADGEPNEAGKRFLKLKEEFLTKAEGRLDEKGQFKFRGFHGTYTVEVTTDSNTFSRTFVVEKGDWPLVVPIML